MATRHWSKWWNVHPTIYTTFLQCLDFSPQSDNRIRLGYLLSLKTHIQQAKVSLQLIFCPWTHQISLNLFLSQYSQSHMAFDGSVSFKTSAAYGHMSHTHSSRSSQSVHFRILRVPILILGISIILPHTVLFQHNFQAIPKITEQLYGQPLCVLLSSFDRSSDTS